MIGVREVCDDEGHQFCVLIEIYTIWVRNLVLHLPNSYFFISIANPLKTYPWPNWVNKNLFSKEIQL